MGRNTEYLPLFEEPTDRELFRRFIALGILNEEKECKDWLYHVPRGEDGVKIIDFEEYIASNREWYLWLLSLHCDGRTPAEIQKIAEERAENNIQHLRKQLGNSQ